MKPIYKVIDDRNRVYLAKDLRTMLGVEQGDIVSTKEVNGKIVITKPIVIENDKFTLDEKFCFAMAATRELDNEQLIELLEQIASLIQQTRD